MKFPEQLTILEQYTPDVIIKRLAPYINDKRQQRITEVLVGRLQSIQLAIECPSDINNAFAAIRTCEALGIGKVHIITPDNSALTARSITQGACYWVNIHYYESLNDFIEYAQSHQLTIAGGTVNATIPLNQVPIEQPLCIFIGNEQRGLSPTAQQQCTIHYKIPMVGMSESLNLSVSAAISLYDTTQRKRAQLGAPGDLSSEQCQQLKAHYYLNSVAPRLACGLFLNHR